MKLTATPFDPQTGELLPVYRDAYLRGDLSRASARQVEEYLSKNADNAYSTVTRWHEMKDSEDQSATPSWVGKQLAFMREQPQRFRRRVATMVTGAAMIAGASMAATNLPTADNLPNDSVDMLAAAPSVDAGAARMVTVKGRILDAQGKPLVGATVLRKGTGYGTTTDASGTYTLRMPAAEAASTLQYGYAGYNDQEMSASDAATAAVTLQARPAKHHRWLFF